jgi:putrescine transport system substrate-binding protein
MSRLDKSNLEISTLEQSSLTQSILSRRGFLKAGISSAALFGLAPLLNSCGEQGEPKKLSFLNWQDYIAADTLDGFTKTSGNEVSYQTYASNDELAFLLNRGSGARRGGRQGSSYDLIVPSNNALETFKNAGLLQALKADKITGLENLRPDVLSAAFDPGNVYSIPWATGTTGIGYDSDVIKTPPDWSVFANPAYKGRMTVLNEAREALAMALISIDRSPNAREQSDLDRATEVLIQLKANLRSFDSKTYLRDLAAGKLVACQAFSSDLLIAQQQRPSLRFVLPPQGATRWIDSLVIPTDAARPGRAHEFISYFLRPEVAAGVSSAAKVDTGNAQAFERLAPEIRNNPTIFPPSDVLKRLPFLEALGEDQQKFDAAWKQVQNARS